MTYTKSERFGRGPHLNPRQQRIVRRLDEEDKLRVSTLSSDFGVTEETIRRDLEFLEKHELLIRVHGGAIPKEKTEGFELPVLDRQSKNMKEKKAIAAMAASFINDGEIIALDASTTCLQLAKNLHHKQLTVITNSISVSIELAHQKDITVILTGGYLRVESMSLVGISSDKIINDYHVDKFFISCSGIDLKWGVSESHELQAQTKKRIASLAEQTFVLADHSKFGHKSLVHWLPTEKIHTIISDQQLDDDIAKQYQSAGIYVHRV
ncbi:DeoR/GlpR family DNA-binding transcription regulator [Geomicrobium sp. JCM 19039]|uniref:DeoR/GlpR family DNA-binding transcription regulator n=1 Tax=Geomicrobium sp. JCM 19039 TaxID=1460636 RepID=UPI00045F3ACB|nr:DeoR/GlpR family DNA-binding transcription regulator [Geomicrobium sp. JCM 19039]GAK12105.1 transcriptional regulator of rhamnose utilization, DeoR family [Geomicrobium sp. JCM 19039]